MTMTTFMDRAAGGYFPLITLTDEELSALDPGDQLAPRPWYDELDEDARELSRQVALRGLMARGIVAGEDAGDDHVRMLLSEPVETMLAIRQAPAFLVIATRMAGEAAWSRVLYARPEGVAVEEDVDGFGLHAISAGPLGELAVRLAEFCDPHAAAGTDGEPRELALTEVARGAGQEVFSRTAYLTHLVRVTLGGDGEPAEERLSIYTLEDRVVVSEATDHGTLTLCEAGPRTLRERMAGLLREQVLVPLDEG